jgi:N-acetylglucosamine malate deacetylase 2
VIVASGKYLRDVSLDDFLLIGVFAPCSHRILVISLPAVAGIHSWVPEEAARRFAEGHRPMLPDVLDQWRCQRPVVVAAHPDDEVIGAGATLAWFPGAVIIHVTDGAPRNRTGWQDVAVERRREADATLALVGIVPGQVVALNYPDGEVQYVLAELAGELGQKLATLHCGVVITHSYEGAHPDHDATAFAVQAACRTLGCSARLLVEMTSYHVVAGRLITGEFLPHENAGAIVDYQLDA